MNKNHFWLKKLLKKRKKLSKTGRSAFFNKVAT